MNLAWCDPVKLILVFMKFHRDVAPLVIELSCLFSWSGADFRPIKRRQLLGVYTFEKNALATLLGLMDH